MMRRDVRTVLDIVNVTVSQTWKQIYNKLNYQRLHKDSDRPEPMTFGHYKMEIGVKLAESRTNRADSTNLRKPSVST